jgi:hypothetical protein
MTDLGMPETRYAHSGDISIAYQTMGHGPLDIVIVPGSISHVEFNHELPGFTAFLHRLSKFARVVTFDKRGQGLSDRVSGVPSLEERMDDVRAVMDAIGSQRAVLLGFLRGQPHEHIVCGDISRTGNSSHSGRRFSPRLAFRNRRRVPSYRHCEGSSMGHRPADEARDRDPRRKRARNCTIGEV